MTQAEAWTVGRLLTWTTDYLKKYGADSPRLDAEILLAEARNCQRIELYTAFNEEPNEVVRTSFRELVKRRAEGTPVAYLVGHKEFYSLAFRVTPDCLIPRPETEHLVIGAIDAAKVLQKQFGANTQLKIVDCCTGSGCVAVAIAKHLPNCSIQAIDLSEAALEVAKQNTAKHSVDNRIDFLQGDLLTVLNDDQTDLHIIVSNPPYISQAEYDKLSREVREFEPKMALLSGEDGGELSRRLFEQSLPKLFQGGYLLVETSPMLAPKLIQDLNGIEGWSVQPTIKDLQGHNRILVARKR